MTGWIFPAGDPAERHAVAVHRLTDAPAPTSWSVDVNRGRVAPSDLAFLWQTGDEMDPWRPGLWAAGVVERYDKTKMEAHWRGSGAKTTYARLDLLWTPIIDRDLFRADADAGGQWKNTVPGSRRHGQMQSPLALSLEQTQWILGWFRPSLRRSINALVERSRT